MKATFSQMSKNWDSENWGFQAKNERIYRGNPTNEWSIQKETTLYNVRGEWREGWIITPEARKYYSSKTGWATIATGLSFNMAMDWMRAFCRIGITNNPRSSMPYNSFHYRLLNIINGVEIPGEML